MEWAEADDWIRHKNHIHHLYIVENRPLHDVMRLMKSRYGFQATPKMYKTKLSRWKFRKHREHQHRRRIPNETQSRNISQCMELIPAPRSCPPPAMTRVYPVTIPEWIFHIIKQYNEGSCRGKTWYTTADGRFTTCKDPMHAEIQVDQFVACWISGLSPTKHGTFVEMGHEMSKACDLIPTLVQAEHPHLVRAVLELLRYYNMARCYDMARIVLAHLHNMTNLYLGPKYPLTQLWSLLLHVGDGARDEVILRALECVFDVLSQECGPFHYRVVQSRISLLDSPLLGQGKGHAVVSKQWLVDDPTSKNFSHFDEMLMDNLHRLQDSNEEELVLDIRQYALELRSRERMESRMHFLNILRSMCHGISGMSYALGGLQPVLDGEGRLRILETARVEEEVVTDLSPPDSIASD